MLIKQVSVFNFGDIFLKPDGPKKEKEANEMINKQWKKDKQTIESYSLGSYGRRRQGLLVIRFATRV